MRRGRRLVGWLALAAVFAGCRHPLASVHPVVTDPLDLARAPETPVPAPAPLKVTTGPDHPFQTVLGYLGLLIGVGIAAGALTRRPTASLKQPVPVAPGDRELARQLNHDVKNGLIPVRNVFRHLAQVARQEPERLPA